MINYSSSIKISQLDNLTGNAITLDDFFPIVDSGSLTTKKISVSNFVNAVFATASIGLNKNLIFQSGSALTGSNNLNFDYTTNILYVTNSINTNKLISNTISASIISASLTGSVYGTSSWANNALTAIYAINAGSGIATTASYVSGSTSNLKTLVINQNGQNNGPYWYTYNNYGVYWVSNTTAANNKSYSNIYLAPSGSSGTNDSSSGVGLWINGGYDNSVGTLNIPLPIYLGGNPSTTNTPTPSIIVGQNGNVGIKTSFNTNPYCSLVVGNASSTDAQANADLRVCSKIEFGNVGDNDWGMIYTSGSGIDRRDIFISTADNGDESIYLCGRSFTNDGANPYKRFCLEPFASLPGYSANLTASCLATVYGNLLVSPDPYSIQGFGGSISASSVTASLYGTASVAYTSSYVTGSIFNSNNPVVSSSYALSSSYSSTASYVKTSSYAENSGNGPKFIAPYLITSSQNVTKPWTTFSTLSASGVNSTGSTGIIQYHLKTGITGPFNLYFRPSSSVNYAYTASLGAGGSGDNPYIESQMIIPLNSLGAFDYAISCSNATFSIKLIGYY